MRQCQGEAGVYWRTARDFRLKSALGIDNSEEADDLSLMAAKTENDRIRRGALQLLDSMGERAAL